MAKFVLALDQGTTSSRAILFDRNGRIHAGAQQEYRQIFPQPGWVEHDPLEIWQSQLSVAQRVIRESATAPRDIAAIGIANQRETTLLWDRQTGQPLANAIVWQDRRTAEICEQLKNAGHEELVGSRSGLVIDAYFSASKLKWLLDNISGARRRAERGELCFGTVDSWLVYKLCGRHVTDASNASRTMLFNIHSMQWDHQLLELFDIPHILLPDIVPTSGIIGYSDESLLGHPIAIAAIAGDQQAAIFGQACHQPGMAKNTYGTGCFMLMNVGEHPMPSSNRMLSTVGWTLDESGEHCSYMLEGSVFMAGATVQWLRDGLGIIGHSAEVELLAASVQDSGGVVLVPAFAGLGAPYWDPHARGLLIGLTRGTNRAHIARAALESIACQTADVLLAMQRDASIALQELRVDGGAAQNDLLMQMQADLLGVPVLRPAVTETTALGAAWLAGLAAGVWSSLPEIASQWKLERRFDPVLGSVQRETIFHAWHSAVSRARDWAPAFDR